MTEQKFEDMLSAKFYEDRKSIHLAINSEKIWEQVLNLLKF